MAVVKPKAGSRTCVLRLLYSKGRLIKTFGPNGRRLAESGQSHMRTKAFLY